MRHQAQRCHPLAGPTPRGARHPAPFTDACDASPVGRIVRLASVSKLETGRVNRVTTHSLSVVRPSGPHLPIPVAELLARVAELRTLLESRGAARGTAGTGAQDGLRRSVALALRQPATLTSAENQLDLVEEVADAVWDGADPGFRYPGKPGPTWELTLAREERRRAVVARLDEIARELCEAVERRR
jgi:hypothetical protein